MIRHALILATAVLAASGGANAQLLPGDGSDGVIEVNLNAVPFSATDITEVDLYPFENLFHIQVSLRPEFDEKLAELTRGKVGYEIWITLCGKRLVTAVIQEEIGTATFVITTDDLQEAKAMTDHLRHPPCARQS